MNSEHSSPRSYSPARRVLSWRKTNILRTHISKIRDVGYPTCSVGRGGPRQKFVGDSNCVGAARRRAKGPGECPGPSCWCVGDGVG